MTSLPMSSFDTSGFVGQEVSGSIINNLRIIIIHENANTHRYWDSTDPHDYHNQLGSDLPQYSTS